MSKLWTFGDSFTAEYSPVGNSNHISNYDKYKEWRGGTLPDIWPTLLSKKLNFELKNLAIGGSSNSGIFRQFLEICEQIESGDILILGWSNVVRFEVANIDENKFNQILPCDEEFKGTYLSKTTINEMLVNHSHKLWVKEVHNWIKFINLFCNKNNIRVFHWTSDYKIFNYYSEIANDEKFIVCRHPAFRDHSIIQYLQQPFHFDINRHLATIEHETVKKIIDYHFGELGHKCQSEYFYNHINGLIFDDEHKENIIVN
jgi:hypothetical protein